MQFSKMALKTGFALKGHTTSQPMESELQLELETGSYAQRQQQIVCSSFINTAIPSYPRSLRVCLLATLSASTDSFSRGSTKPVYLQ